MEWNGANSRACVPTALALMSDDVLSSTRAEIAHSTSPFSVGVYVCEGDVHNPTFRSLPLVYVSEEVVGTFSPSHPPSIPIASHSAPLPPHLF